MLHQQARTTNAGFSGGVISAVILVVAVAIHNPYSTVSANSLTSTCAFGQGNRI
jgi:hypothetical protein